MSKTLTAEDHRAALLVAVQNTTLSPEELRWHYIQLAFLTTGGNVTATARVLHMHRRTLQRLLAKRRPKRRELAHG